MSKSNTPVAFALAIVEAYQRRGISPDAALALADVRREHLLLQNRITADQLERLSGRAMRELDDEALGWFRRPLPWGSYGMLCRASLSSPDLSVATARWCRHHGLLTDDIRLGLSRDGGLAIVQIQEMVDLGSFREFCLLTVLRNLHGVACWLGDTRIPLVDITFPFAAPAHADCYGHMFDGAVLFGGEQAELRFDAAYLDLPVLRDDSMLRQMLKRPLPIIVRQYRRDRLLAREVLRLLELDPGKGADDIAEGLNLSERSLYRHLRQEDTTFQALKDVARRRKAERMLTSTTWSVKKIAWECGFTAEESFVRAFKSWTGQTPRSFSLAARVGGKRRSER